MRNRWLAFIILSVLVLSTLGAAAQQDKGTIRGYVFRDSNQNGVFDQGEEGIPGVFVTVSYGEYSHTYYTGAGDPSPQAAPKLPAPSPGPGSYGPTPLPAGSWKVTLHVPDGYRATSKTELYASVPVGGAATGVNFGVYGSGSIAYSSGTGVGMGGAAGVLPVTGGVVKVGPGHVMALIVALLGLVALVGTPWCVAQVKQAHKRWW